MGWRGSILSCRIVRDTVSRVPDLELVHFRFPAILFYLPLIVFHHHVDRAGGDSAAHGILTRDVQSSRVSGHGSAGDLNVLGLHGLNHGKHFLEFRIIHLLGPVR